MRTFTSSIKSFFIACILAPLFSGSVLAAGCNVGTFSSLVPPEDATNVVVDTATILPASGTTPEYCEIKGRIDTTSTSVINFQVRAPNPWNGKLFMTGNGGFAGTISLTAGNDLAFAIPRNYAIAGTDTGHVGGANPIWALNNPLGVKNYGYRAVHLTTVITKEILLKYYGQPVTYSYFDSCSNGGRQGLMSAQRYPNDFNGIVVGAPAIDITGMVLSFTNIAKAQYPDGNFANPVIPTSKLPLLTQTILNKCDALDGISDGVLNDPRDCNFKPKKDLPRCVNDLDAPDCFTKIQLSVLDTIYSETDAAKDQSFPGYLPGAESFASPFSWTAYVFGSLPLATPTTAHSSGVPSRGMFFAEGTFDNFITFNNLIQPVSYLDFDLNSKVDVKDLLTIAPVLNATDADLTAFKKNGGRLIMYHGWNDPVVSPLRTIEYYKDITTQMNGKNKTKDFARLFMIPGTLHCVTGPGPSTTWDTLTALENWVEHGIAPDKVIASNSAVGGMSRPLCPYPQVAVLNAGLDPTDPVITKNAANFHCAKKDHDDNDNH